MRRLAMISGLLALIIFAGGFQQDPGESRKKKRRKKTPVPVAPLKDLCHVRVTWTESPQSKAVVSWTTTAPGNGHVVHFDTTSKGGKPGSYGNRAKAAGGQFQSAKSMKKSPYFHHARLENLRPSTTYYFVVASDGHQSEEYHFVTAPEDDREFRILFGGDSRSDPTNRRRMNEYMAGLLKKDPSIIALAHGGDYVTSGNDLGLWMGWLTDHELTTTGDGRMLPVIPARGNHDRGNLFNAVFDSPGGKETENYFMTMLGAQAVLVTLNSETSLDGAQREFLESSLKKTAALRWILAQYHEPAYAAVKRDGKAKEAWVPLFEKYNVSLVCEADGHCIKRTVPIRNGKEDPSGVVYVGEGGLGVGQRPPKNNAWFVKPPGIVGRGDHVQRITFSPKGLTVEVLLPDGKVFDTHTIKPKKR